MLKDTRAQLLSKASGKHRLPVALLEVRLLSASLLMTRSCQAGLSETQPKCLGLISSPQAERTGNWVGLLRV